eukprot:1828483-Rhodomonas_salina.1
MEDWRLTSALLAQSLTDGAQDLVIGEHTGAIAGLVAWQVPFAASYTISVGNLLGRLDGHDENIDALELDVFTYSSNWIYNNFNEIAEQ